MTACELGPDVADQLSTLAEAPRVSILLGAGASMAAGLPGWDELAVRLLSEAGAIDDWDTARAFLARQDPALAAEAARAVSADWVGVVRDSLYGPEGADLYPGSLHLAVANLAASHPEVSLLTLNLDDLLEEALRDALEDLGRVDEVMSRTAAAPRAGSRAYEVQHLHGMLPRSRDRDASGVVLTLSDFNRLAATPHPWQAAALGEAMSQGPLVLVGTTFRDADIRQWLHAIGEQVKAQGESVVALVAREGLGLSRRQFSDVADAARQQWLAVGVDAVMLQDHADAAQILREVPWVRTDGYLLPRARTARLWNQHQEDFWSLQSRHSEMLDADRAVLPTPKDHESDLTLWLADGSDQLIRWASHDRLYRAPNKLRRVAHGYDSPWTAARAMARSEVVVDSANTPLPGSRRWRTVVAAPLTLGLPGGPNLVVGALSAATTAKLDGDSDTEWRTAMADLVETWATRLPETNG